MKTNIKHLSIGVAILFGFTENTQTASRLSAAWGFFKRNKEVIAKVSPLYALGGLGLYSGYTQPKPEDTCDRCKPAIPLVFLGKNHGRLGDGYFADQHMGVTDKDRQQCLTLGITSERLVAPSREVVSQNLFEKVRPYYYFKSLEENRHGLSDEALQRMHDNYRAGVAGAKPCSAITGDPAAQEVCRRIPGKGYAYATKPDWTPYLSTDKVYFNAGVIASYLKVLSAPTDKEISDFRRSDKNPGSLTNVWIKRKDLPQVLKELEATGVPAGNIKCYPKVDPSVCYAGSNNTKSLRESARTSPAGQRPVRTLSGRLIYVSTYKPSCE